MNNAYYFNQASQTIGSVAIAGIIATQLLSSNPLETQAEDLPMSPNVYSLPVLPYALNQYKNLTMGNYYQGSDPFEKTVSIFYTTLLSSQESLGAEFEKVLYSKLWELYES